MDISIERLNQIEQERQETVTNPAYQNWFKQLNVSQSYSNPEPLYNAKEMNAQYDFTKFKTK